MKDDRQADVAAAPWASRRAFVSARFLKRLDAPTAAAPKPWLRGASLVTAQSSLPSSMTRQLSVALPPCERLRRARWDRNRRARLAWGGAASAATRSSMSWGAGSGRRRVRCDPRGRSRFRCGGKMWSARDDSAGGAVDSSEDAVLLVMSRGAPASGTFCSAMMPAMSASTNRNAADDQRPRGALISAQR